ncbi:MAG TPA: hypothetical protein VEJ16_06235 [Alphaproteobacteria bacterium]|nr:hypothetical protein [Alphaproteobacteria bacterium]
MFATFGGFADGYLVADGRVRRSNVRGIGFEARRDRYALMKPLLANG